MSNNNEGVHLYTQLENDDWTQRQEEVNALIVNAVGVEGWKKLAVQPDVRKEVRVRLDAKNAQVAALQQQIETAKTDFTASLKDYLTPLTEKAPQGFAAGLKPAGSHAQAAADSKGTGFGGKAAS